MILNITNFDREKITIDTEKLFNKLDELNLSIDEILDNLNNRYQEIETLQVIEQWFNGKKQEVIFDTDKCLSLDNLIYLIYNYESYYTGDLSISDIYHLLKECNDPIINFDVIETFTDGNFSIINDLESYVYEFLPEEVQEVINNNRYISFDYESYFKDEINLYSNDYFYSDYLEKWIYSEY